MCIQLFRQLSDHLYKLNHKSMIYGIDPALIASIVAILIAIFSPWIIELWKRKLNKTNLKILDKKVDEQNKQYVGRLIILNDCNRPASSVEVYVDKIWEAGILRNGFSPVPLWWTHGQLYRSGPIIRNIQGHQTVYLDIFIYWSDKDSDKFVLATPITGIPTYSKLNTGNTEVLLKIYQGSGQVVSKKVSIEWDGIKVPKIDSLS